MIEQERAAFIQRVFPGWRESLLAASIATVQEYTPDEPYWGCFSGGKDSVVLKEVVRLAGAPVEWIYNVTTIDPPELVAFIRKHHPDVRFSYPRRSFWGLAQTNGFPTRCVRWCCKELKETKTPPGRRMLFGVRAAESPQRAANWQSFTFHRRTKEYAVLPILHWKDTDVWAFIRERNLPYCKLYDEGFKRLGCIGCPMSGKAGRLRAFARWPAFERMWKRLFRQTWERRTGSLQRDGRVWFGDRYFDNWEEMWEWWLNDGPLPGDECQGTLELFS